MVYFVHNGPDKLLSLYKYSVRRVTRPLLIDKPRISVCLSIQEIVRISKGKLMTHSSGILFNIFLQAAVSCGVA